MNTAVRSLLLPLLGAAAFALGCGSSGVTSVTSPTSARCQPSITSSSPSFGAAGGTGTVNVSVARECSWSAAASASWIAITAGGTGQGDGTVSFRVAENTGPSTRSATITVADQHADIGQQGTPCTYSVTGPADLAAAGQQASISVRTQSGCGWQAQADADWATLQPQSGDGDGDIAVVAIANHGEDVRTMTVTVAGQQILIRQLSDTTPPTTPSPPPPSAPPPPPAPTIDLSGKVTNLKGTCPSVRFTLQGYLVTTSLDTVYTGGTCKDVKNDRTVDVTGTVVDTNAVSAESIKVQR